MRIKLLSIL